jgi:hypothetical protein
VRLASPGSSSPLVRPSQEDDKENAPVEEDAKKPAAADEETGADATTPTAAAVAADGDASAKEPEAPPSAVQELEPGALPTQIADMLSEVKQHLETFTTHPPHTIQRLAELILSPRAHYKALASYLHAVDRVVQVTSGTSTYPLPPAVSDMSGLTINGVDSARDPAGGVAWSNLTTTAAATLGSDEALGGALLTPIPWLTRRSPESASNGSDNSHGGSAGAQIHSEGTETIDGPNGIGSVETVSVSVNGVPSTGHARGVTQGELLRQEQRAGVVPVSQLSRNHGHVAAGGEGRGADEEEGEEAAAAAAAEEGQEANTTTSAMEEAAAEGAEEEETPHARGPEEIGVDDTGPQSSTTSYMGEGGVEMQGIDVAAAVGRSREEEEHPQEENMADVENGEAASGVPRSPGAESTGTKREAEEDMESEPAKKPREDGEDEEGKGADVAVEDKENEMKDE